ncbi:hypothetical protein WJ58_29570 [Burkholderia ubonensis]|nr:hypothetical protein WJ58_29570 [Burkholderia ubonensis]
MLEVGAGVGDLGMQLCDMPLVLSITMFRNQLPRASCAKLVPSLILPSGSGRLLNTRKVWPAKRNASPSRFRSRPFSGTQPSDFRPR